MDLALPGLVIFAAFLPGGLFLTVYALAFRVGVKVPAEFPSVTGPIAVSVLVSIALHAAFGVLVTLLIARPLGLPEPRPDLAFDLLVPRSEGSPGFMHAVAATRAELGWVIAYLLGLFSVSCGLGYLAYLYVGQPGSKLQFLSLENRWHYLLDGRYAVFPTLENQPQEPDATIISAVTVIGDSVYVYVGFLEEYTFRSDGSLGTLFLSVAARREFQRDDPQADSQFVASGNWLGDERFVELGQGVLALEYASIVNLHIWHIKLDDATPAATAAEAAA